MIFAMMATICSCSQSPELETPTPDTELEGKTITATISLNGKANTKIGCDYGAADSEVWDFTWEEGDQVIMTNFDGSNSIILNIVATSSDDKTATFTGTIPSDKIDTFSEYYIIYSNDTDVITTQNGDLDSLCMISDKCTLEPDQSEITPELKHVGGFMTLDIDFSALPEHWVDVTLDKVVYSGVNCFCWDATFEELSQSAWGDGTLDMTKEEISITPTEPIAVEMGGEAKLHINILPTTLSSGDKINATLYFSNGTRLEIEKTASKEITFARAAFSTTSIIFDLDKVTYMFDGVDYPTDRAEYYITKPEHLKALAALANSGKLESETYNTFYLDNNITLNSNDSWTPIGYKADAAFHGVFDGQGYSISGHKAGSHNGTFQSVGLFGYIEGESTTVKSLVIKNGNSELIYTGAGTHVGILTGTLQDGATLLNCGCDVQCSVVLGYRGAIGGLAGLSSSSFITNCYNQGSVEYKSAWSTQAVNIGGICGSGNDGKFTNCYNSGSVSHGVSSVYNKGAIVGGNSTLDIEKCYYLTGCAGDGVKGIGSNNTDAGSVDVTSYGQAISKSDAELKLLSGTLNSNGIYNASNWKDVTNGYPVFTFQN